MPPERESHGRELRQRVVGGIQIAEVAVPAGLRLPAHVHGNGQLVCVLAGSYGETWRRGSLRLRPGSFLFRPPGEVHENVFDRDDVRALVISYPPARVAALTRDGGPPAEIPAIPPLLRQQVLLELERDDGAATHTLEGLALVLLGGAERALQPTPSWLPDALAFIERHLHESISLVSVARALGVQRSVLAREFRRHAARSVGQAIREARLGRALDRIRSSCTPLSQIAVECGFFDQAHLGRITRRGTGRTPAEIRRAAMRSAAARIVPDVSCAERDAGRWRRRSGTASPGP